ncbi:MAG: shikimate dehydrogenase [Burkholderiales bacterium]|nr:shikimate dehydrogenase [Bacteroidia bacterium]
MMNFGLIGKSLSHSFSKAYLEKKFIKEDKIGFQYSNFDLENLDSFMEIISANHLTGLNVTKPYKEAIIPYLNELDVTAKEIGAVNCVKISWQSNTPFLIGYNTDYYGFAQSIKPFLEPIHQRALILGTGGASKAIAYALKNVGVDFYYVTSGKKKASNYFHYSELNEYVLNAFKLIVNCTPLGMYPKTDTCPEIPFEFIDREHLLYDLIYNPEETLFLKKGKERGAATINGLNMLKLQADKAWEIWHT